MKKLMIAAAIACATVASQAASFTWSSAENDCIDDDTLAAGLAAGKTYAADGWSIDDNSWSLAYTLTLSYGGNTDTLTGTVETDMMGGVLMDLSSSLVEQGETAYNIDYTLAYTTTVTDGQGKTWTLTSDTIEDVFTVKSKGDLSLVSTGVSSWSTPGPTPTPEPTSGLLLLLGVAGLALRRKQK